MDGIGNGCDRTNDAQFADTLHAQGINLTVLGVREISELGEYVPPGQRPELLDQFRKGHVPFANKARGDEPKDGKPLMFAFGAEFVEVRIYRLTRETECRV